MKKLKWIDKELVTLNTLIEKISGENNRQIGKWKIQTRTPFEWMCYLTEEVGELAEAISETEYRNGNEQHIFDEAIQVATLALKIAEMSAEAEKG